MFPIFLQTETLSLRGVFIHQGGKRLFEKSRNRPIFFYFLEFVNGFNLEKIALSGIFRLNVAQISKSYTERLKT